MVRNLKNVVLGILLHALLFSTFTSFAENKTSPKSEILKDEWYAIHFQGTHVGHAHLLFDRVWKNGTPYIRHQTIQKFTILRMGTKLTFATEEKCWEEEASGKVIWFKSSQDSGNTSMKISGKLEGDLLHVALNTGKKSLPYPEGALGPWAADRQVKAKKLSSGETASINSFNFLAPDTPYTLTYTIKDKEEIDILGEKRWLRKSEASMSHMPGMTLKAWSDDNDNMLKASMNFGVMGNIEMISTSKKIALKTVTPKELMAQSLIEPDQLIKNPFETKKASFLIKTSEQGTELNLTNDRWQKVSKIDNTTFKVEVTTPHWQDNFSPFTSLPVTNPDYSPFMEHSPYIQSQDEKVIALAQEIKGSETHSLKLAQKIQEEIRSRIRIKNLSTGFASAAEVARSLSGDCTEHAVLSAAVARAMGLPSRVVTGLVYVPPEHGNLFTQSSSNGVFGFHMWAEVMVAPDVWWPVDAALGKVGACHIAASKTELTGMNPMAELSLPVMSLLHGIQIEVHQIQ